MQSDELKTRRLPINRIYFVGALCLLVLVLILRSCSQNTLPTTNTQAHTPETALTYSDEEFIVTNSELSYYICSTGSIDAGRKRAINVPFTDKVKSVNFEYGQKVEKGDLLLQLDAQEIEAKLREAKIAQMKAQEKLQTLENWENSRDVARARRSLQEARTSLELAENEFNSSDQLYALGIIPLQRKQSDERSLLVAQNNFKSAQESLSAVLKEGGQKKINIAQFENQNAEIHVSKLEKKLADSCLKAPISGILSKPSGSLVPNITPGSELKEASTIANILDLSRVRVTCLIPEADINSLHKDQAATIRGEGFRGIVLNAHVEHVNYQAQPKDFSGATQFEIKVLSDPLSEEQRNRIQLGMSAHVRIEAQRKEHAILIPLNALDIQADGVFVHRILDENTERTDIIPITTGKTQLNSIEVLSGLEPGDRLRLH